MERGEFTMGIARRNISVTMGLGEQGLDEQPWKGMVKKLVNEAIVSATHLASHHHPQADSRADNEGRKRVDRNDFHFPYGADNRKTQLNKALPTHHPSKKILNLPRKHQNPGRRQHPSVTRNRRKRKRRNEQVLLVNLLRERKDLDHPLTKAGRS